LTDKTSRQKRQEAIKSILIKDLLTWKPSSVEQYFVIIILSQHNM